MDKEKLKMHFSTRAVHAGYQPNEYGAWQLRFIKHQLFVFDSAEQGGRRFALEEDGYIYRLGNPHAARLKKIGLP